MGSVKISNITKKFGDVTALHDINLDIKEGEFFALLGPSGCGKTTTMRCIAGFESPTSGKIYIGDNEVENIPANKRNCGMVFQSYALFPHMNVFDNVAYSLNIKELNSSNPVKQLGIYARLLNKRLGKTPKAIQEKVMKILQYVELDKYANRLTSELSGGQQQRVALARALVMEPAVLLMDEPLSNLDQKLRHSMRNTIRSIQQDLGITTIFVTHDQEEAMSMADRIAVMDKGEIVQIGTPTDLYSNPSTPFIADFVGTSNILKGEVVGDENGLLIVSGDGFKLKSSNSTAKKDVDIIIRPEHVMVEPVDSIVDSSTTNVIEGTVLMSTYLGSIVRYDIQVGEYQLIVDTTYSTGANIFEEGKKVKLTVEFERVLLI
ncbi:ABC transporter ATP-binding protein [Psychrobacillus sp. FSL K6-2684]|uniref:ABC transporter ATP-binding protein n=1 Tax=Psychrobacillus faecigallinarum TaxID=2762235 RepID=A0ABR8R8K9_9BACI|nr:MULTISPECIES: ABC transporter ATP-binding protein [Psychrobacillus]MBD7944141.1 ABC transporter ATP-binding protein [Psychrobacillus faecigallinarum]QEY21012.1 ABC transporter ATP-binding protein [Psychrobacillus sp. AK 1817]